LAKKIKKPSPGELNPIEVYDNNPDGISMDHPEIRTRIRIGVIGGARPAASGGR
jgi:hypothetical protein